MPTPEEEVIAGQDLSISLLMMEAAANDESLAGNPAQVEALLQADTGIIEDLRSASDGVKRAAQMASHMMATYLASQLAEARGEPMAETVQDVASRIRRLRRER